MVSLKVWPPTEFNRRTRFANLLKQLPWNTASADCIYLGEVLEHFTCAEGLRLLSECHRVLKHGGVIRVRVPDNARFWRNYLTEFDATIQRPRSEWTDDHSRWIEKFFRDICTGRRRLRSAGHYHKWLYDEVTLTRTLEQVGFTNVERRSFLDSAIPDIAAVETRDDLIVEGSRH
jgi:predicted SAM-dependent methyltransferase